MTNKGASWLAFAGWLLLVVWVGYSMYQSGRAKEAVEQSKVQVAEYREEIKRITERATQQDSAISQLRQDVVNAKARVIIVDKVQNPSIDSALAVVSATLDSAGKAALTQVVLGYEAKLAVRDTTIARLEALISTQDNLIALQRTLVRVQQSIDSVQAVQTKQLTKLAKPGLVRRLLDALPLALVIRAVL